MWKLSTRGRYGTRVMLQLANNYSQGPVMLREIARREQLPLKYLEQIVPPLRSAGLVVSSRGPGGGYQLSRHPDEITLREILEVLEREIVPTRCVADPLSCQRSEECTARDAWTAVGHRILDTLEEITLGELSGSQH